MAPARFHSFAKLRAQIHNAVLAYRGVFPDRISTEKIAVPRTALVRGPNLRADCHRPEPPAGFVLVLRAGFGNPQHDQELIAKQFFLLWQSAELIQAV
jgi:hypothetical protein